MFHLKPSRIWSWHVIAYFLEKAWMPDHKLAYILKSKPEIYTAYILAQWGKQDTVLTCPSAIIYKFYLPGATGQAPMSSPARPEILLPPSYLKTVVVHLFCFKIIGPAICEKGRFHHAATRNYMYMDRTDVINLLMPAAAKTSLTILLKSFLPKHTWENI